MPRFSTRVVLLALCLVPALHPAPSRAAVPDADSLYRNAMLDIRKDTVESRRRAMETLERASLLAPDSIGYHLELARLYFRMGFLGQARKCFERISRLRPDLAEAHLGQGLAWRRDYLKYLDGGSLRRALEELREAARISPEWAEAWLQLVPLLVEDARLGEAMAAAEKARAADPTRVDGVLAVAHLAYRVGQVERADTLFRAALPRLDRQVLEKYLDISPIASEADTAALSRLPQSQQAGFTERFWKEHDPDLASPENEARIEYWSRVTQAYFLFYSQRRKQWDQRGEIYVRYGPPQKADYNPVGMSLNFRMGRHGNFPMNVLVWSYPELGMTVPMQDRLLSEFYLPPVSLVRSTDPAPDPDSLARRNGSLATAGGRGVFAKLAPGMRALPLEVSIARFEGASQPRLLAWLQSPGTANDMLWGEWVVLDTTRNEVARLRRPLGLSACDPGELQAADFASDLPPGPYLIGLTVRNSRGPAQRGLFRARVHLGEPQAALELSDIVVSCEAPGASLDPAAPAVRLTAIPGARVAGPGPLVAYFEAYHLKPGSDGLARFEYEYAVESAEIDPRFWMQRLLAPRRGTPEISASRREAHSGSLRRQFVTIPIQTLPPGSYRIRITVRDLVTGRQVTRTAGFQRETHARAPGGSSAG